MRLLEWYVGGRKSAVGYTAKVARGPKLFGSPSTSATPAGVPTRRNARWCSDGLEITCDNGEKVRVALALDCGDREAMGHVATTGGITAEDVQDLMVTTVEHRYGQVNRVPEPIEWLTDNGSCYTVRNTRASG